jgi:hypothetical protein
MRKESRKIAKAFMERKPANAARTRTDGDAVYLFGNKIAWRDADDNIHLTLAEYPTVTTRERLNAICELMWGKRPFHQHKNLQFYDDEEIDEYDVITIHNILLAR